MLSKLLDVGNCFGSYSHMTLGSASRSVGHPPSSPRTSTPRCPIWTTTLWRTAVRCPAISLASSLIIPLVNNWKHRFSSECMTLLHDQAFGAKMPTYATVLQLDRKLRAFPVPPILQVAGFGNTQPRQSDYPDTIMLTLQRHIVLAIREMSKLSLSLNLMPFG